MTDFSAKAQTREFQSDIALIGAGPIGLEMAVALKRAGIKYVHLEKGQIGHTISWFPQFMRFFSSPDRIAISGVTIPRTDESKCTKEEYLAYLRAIVTQFDLSIRTYEEVLEVAQEPTGFLIRTKAMDGENYYHVSRVIFAIGDMHHPRLLNVPGEDLPHVSHYFMDTHRYFRKRLLIVGGHNSTVEAALRCYYAGATVSINSRGGEFDPDIIKPWLFSNIQNRIRDGRIAFYPRSIVKEIRFGMVTLASIASNEAMEVSADFVLALTGYEADMSLMRKIGVTLDACQKPSYNPQTMETDVEGVYVIGTATAGTQDRHRVFIETCHIQVRQVLAALTGAPPPVPTVEETVPET